MLGQQLLNGVVLGATYALFATGFTLVFGVLRVIDLTYGVLVSVAGLLAWWLTAAGLPLSLALPLDCLACAALAVALQAVLMRRKLPAGLPSFAGPDIRRLPATLLPQSAIEFAGLRVTVAQLLVLAAALAAVLALTVALRSTRWGIAVRGLA